MKSIEKRFNKEAASFDSIALERSRHNQIPDMRANFVNEYFYNNIWRNSTFLRQEHRPLCDWIISLLKNADVRYVIELGSGNGWLCLELARAGFDVVGLDISKESIRIAREYFNSLRN